MRDLQPNYRLVSSIPGIMSRRNHRNLTRAEFSFGSVRHTGMKRTRDHVEEVVYLTVLPLVPRLCCVPPKSEATYLYDFNPHLLFRGLDFIWRIKALLCHSRHHSHPPCLVRRSDFLRTTSASVSPISSTCRGFRGSIVSSRATRALQTHQKFTDGWPCFHEDANIRSLLARGARRSP